MASNRVDVFSEYERKVRGDQLSLLESSPMVILPEVESSRGNLNRSTSLRFSKAGIGDTSIELFFQDGGVRDPHGDVVSAGNDETQLKHDVAALEAMELFFQDAEVRSSHPDGKDILQSKQKNVVDNVAQPHLLNSTLASSVPNEVLGNVVRKKAAQARERIYDDVDAQREETGGRRASRSSQYELDGSENYRAVPTTVGYRADGNQQTGSQPDIQRLKRIMSGAESRYTDEVIPSSEQNSSIQNDAIVSEMTRSKVMSKDKPAVFLATQSDAGWDEYCVSRSTGNGWVDEDARANERVGAGRLVV